MAIYSLSLRSTVGAAAAASWAAQAAAGNEPMVLEVRWVMAVTTGSLIGLGRSANIPVLTGATAFLAEDEARPTGLTQASTTFSTAPTQPVNFMRRTSLSSGSAGTGIVWVFTRGVVLAAAGPALVIWNINAVAASVDIDCVVDE